MSDVVNHPKHYNSHPSGIECIDVVEHFGFNLGNVIKYLWRAEEKGAPIKDLKKASWYLDREIQKRERELANSGSIGIGLGQLIPPSAFATDLDACGQLIVGEGSK
ncbi:DUF3310 domain-containing protein [Caballeronia glebae]|uniref:DUF3310 domain-containing protein n=1 Tax=Caballeronia glebae TaxID=1777143 RepID=UPI0038BCCE08